MMIRVLIAQAVLVCAVIAVGCDSGIKRVPAAGTVTLDGQPLKEGVLLFSPDPSKGNNARVGCSGPISNGKFNLTTAGMSRADNGPGAPVGWFKVTYSHPNEGSLKDGAAVPKVAPRYAREETTPLLIELTDPPPAEGYKIELQSK